MKRVLEVVFILIGGAILATIAAIVILIIAGSAAIHTIIGEYHGQHRH